MVVSDNRRLFERACQLAEGGGLWRNPRFGPPRYKGELFVGSNYRMSEMEAAIDLVQLGKLEQVVRRFRHVSRRVCRQLGSYADVRPQRINDPAGVIGYMLRFFPATCDPICTPMCPRAAARPSSAAAAGGSCSGTVAMQENRRG